jgi:hypothetical protein
MAPNFLKTFFTLLVAVAAFAYCQANEGALHLVVTDTTGHGVIAAVQIISQANHYSKELSTRLNGLLDLNRLPFGLYRLEIRSSGLASVQTSIEIHSSIPTQNAIRMNLPPLTESVIVRSTDTLLAVDQAGSIDVIGKTLFATASAQYPVAPCRTS